MLDFLPLGDRAFLARFEDEATAAAWAAALRHCAWPGVEDVVLAYRDVGVFADPARADLDALADALRAIEPWTTSEGPGETMVIPVLYDGEDLAEVADRLGLSIEEVVRHHAAEDYRVFAIGFLPGFPYAGDLPDALAGLPRRESPRLTVPPGSVAIVERQTAIYPQASPGGWHLIGRTPLTIVDLDEAWFPIRAGDRLRFEPIDAHRYELLRGKRLERKRGAR